MRIGPFLIGIVVVFACTSCGKPSVSYAEARAVVNRRCLECHAEKPTNRAFPVAPQGVMFDTASEMKQYAERIEATATVDDSMPLANMTAMTQEEREILRRWVEAGANVP
jgi:uncharacterized membrane protein